ncbi:helix-turn-helix domain-containing protein [Anatilimnocola sp. NA78]|uniref:helix-turn-helix domain-containing protein n=1 Tax=Anatilimnocola sp. NA78 TaxID=3415683 RepID=UPI003CE4A1CE
MAGKNLASNEAAAKLGVTEDQLATMRQKGEIFGVRTGSGWEFKPDEVDRVVSERAGGSALNADDFDLTLAGLSSPSNTADANEAILVSEEELGRSPEGTNSTIIGKKNTAKSAADSDLKLATEDMLSEGSNPLLESTSPSGILGGSDVNLGGSGTGSIKMAGSDVALGAGMELGEDDLSMADSSAISSPPKKAKPPVDDDDSDEIDLDSDSIGMASGSVIGSGIGSDVTLRGGDSGINLKPTDSGLSLEEEPLDLGGSAVDSLELPEDDDVIALDDDSGDPDQATQLKQDDQFLLSPTDSLGDDESDSGSQVIALEDSESFDTDAATMLRSAGAVPMSEDPFGSAQIVMEPFAESMPVAGGVGMAGMPGMAGAPVYVQVPVVEAPYSVWNVLGLFFVTLMLVCCGMLTLDILLNMWVFDSQSSMSMALMDAAISTFGLDK